MASPTFALFHCLSHQSNLALQQRLQIHTTRSRSSFSFVNVRCCSFCANTFGRTGGILGLSNFPQQSFFSYGIHGTLRAWLKHSCMSCITGPLNGYQNSILQEEWTCEEMGTAFDTKNPAAGWSRICKLGKKVGTCTCL